MMSEKRQWEMSTILTFEIRFIHWRLDLGVGSNLSLAGTGQLLVKVKYNVRPKTTEVECKTFITEENIVQQHGTLPRV